MGNESIDSNINNLEQELTDTINNTKKWLFWLNFSIIREKIKNFFNPKNNDNKTENITPTNNNTIINNIDTSKIFGIAENGWEYTSNNSFTNHITGKTYKLYDQTIGPRAWYQYNDWKDMSYRWCMLTSAAVVASSLWNYNITPWDLFNHHRHVLVRDSVPKESNGKLSSNLIYNWKNDANNGIIDNITKHLKTWNPAIIMVKGSHDGGNNKFTSSQHYMALLDISDDWSKIFVWNSCKNLWGRCSSNGWFPTNDILTSVREATLFTPTQT